jgi:hypothetical protein
METLIVSTEEVSSWALPPFQRPLRINAKVQSLAEEIKTNQTSIPGVLTLGKLKGANSTFIVDGQHRVEAFKLSGLPEAIADIRVIHFDTMADMAEEFVHLNSSLVRMRPDDVLRGLEHSTPNLQRIRKECPFVGYDNIRRSSTSSPIVGMSQLLRSWAGAATETPSVGGASAVAIASYMPELECEQLIHFLKIAHASWGRDPEYYRLWATLNLCMTMWMWRRIVLHRAGGQQRYTTLTVNQFKQCMMSMSASPDYIDWLQGRSMGDRDRSPCYNKIKTLFTRRLAQEGYSMRPKFPQPGWATNK